STDVRTLRCQFESMGHVYFPRQLAQSRREVGGWATGISWRSSSLTAGCTTQRDVAGDGWQRNRNHTRSVKGDDGAIPRSTGSGMKRLTRAEKAEHGRLR